MNSEPQDYDRPQSFDRDEREPLDLKSPSPIDNFAASIGSRNLMIIIVTMPLVFMIVVMAIVAIFGGREEEPVAAAPAAVRSEPVETLAQPAVTLPAAPVLPANAAGALSLPKGAEAGAIALDGDRLAVRIDGPDGSYVAIYDLTSGAVVQTIPIVPEAN